jgi:hypothetical protein
MTPFTLDIVIDELVLRGVPAEQRFDLADSLGNTLTELAETSIGMHQTWSSREESSRRLPPIRLANPAAASLGEAVARSTLDALLGGRGDL